MLFSRETSFLRDEGTGTNDTWLMDEGRRLMEEGRGMM